MTNAIWITVALILGMIVGAKLMKWDYENVILDAAETTKLSNEIVQLYKQDQEDSIEQYEEFANIMINENIMLRQKLKKLELGGK